VGYDVTAPDRRPVELGIAAAHCSGASRIIVCVYATPERGDRLGSRQADEDRVAEAVRAVDEVAHESLTIECRAVDGTNVARGLHEVARSAQARVLLVGSTRPRAPRALPGSLVERIVHGSPCPIAVVPCGWEPRPEYTAIGVGYADSEEGVEALRRAHALARRIGATLRVLTAVAADLVDGPEADAALRDRLDGLGSEVTVETTAVSGDPAGVLVDASRTVDLLVCGSRGYGARGVVALSGVARRVTLEAYCPVVVLPRGGRPPRRAVAPEASSAAERGYSSLL
jgi:nucleotide-binding universal stress UspA family protein